LKEHVLPGEKVYIKISCFIIGYIARVITIIDPFDIFACGLGIL
jgi:hypothetical protein